jgi:hypothetical protein
MSDINGLGLGLLGKEINPIIFQNSIDDLREYLHYWAFSKPEGKKWVRNNFFLSQFVIFVSLLLILGFTDSLSVSIVLGIFIYLFSFIIVGLRPGRWIAKRTLKRNIDSFSEQDIRRYELPKELTISDDVISVSSNEETNIISWKGVREIEKTDKFIRIQFNRNNYWLIPKRAFNSDKEFDETYEKLSEYKNKGTET